MTAIEQARKERGFTQRTVAAIMGISLTRYKSIEFKPHRATVDEADILRLILRKPIRHLFPDLVDGIFRNRDAENHALNIMKAKKENLYLNQRGGRGQMSKTNMYTGAKTWNPFKGCHFGCKYCKPSFQAQAKRQLHNCKQCYEFVPHGHPTRLKNIPSASIVFVAGNGDIAFADPTYVRLIIEAIRKRGGNQTFYLQSKRPEYMAQFIDILPATVALVTTLETNRDKGYSEISKAPAPSERYRQFLALNYPRKIVTIEPVLDFDTDVFADWILAIEPEYVWLGFNSRPKQVILPEPPTDKLQEFVRILATEGIEVRGKQLRGLPLKGIK